ncbi:hypothetical protein FEZ60_30040 [Rhodococcus sp. MS16]|uniref:H+/gluconate symporter-like permease n=1 Tax=Nocardia globerula TaxID=1818 RepID=A0A652YP75_NOCGL|nr:MULTISPECIES: hypothetical protein [Rhodococcus]NMD63099.1 hypothetical protein [Nocardia globerula]NRI69766.1 hypothetical protein [Rhodococcus sp. MS16]PVX68560.1 hypothetical protein C8E04_5953 [Rhodococcus globerulus]ROZ50424.1 hypothetical protein EEB13_11610 [Rhodococcus sp. WS3]
MEVNLTAAHWVYLAGILVILATMMLRKNIVVPAVLGTFLTAFVFSDSLVTGLASIFNASLVAAKELFNIFLIIALVTAMLGALRQMGADRLMVAPFRKVMRGGTSSFLVLAAVTYMISLFFWPTPAVPLIGAVLIPVAIRAGLSPMAVGMSIAICGQGMALSADYIIKVAPGLSATAAGVDPDVVADRALVMSLIVGLTALIITWLTQRRNMRAPSPELLTEWESRAEHENGRSTQADGDSAGGTPVPSGTLPGTGAAGGSKVLVTAGANVGVSVAERVDTDDSSMKATVDHVFKSIRAARTFAVLVPLAYLAFIVYLLIGKFTDIVPDLKGGDAAAMVGGIAALILFAAAATNDKQGFFETTSEHLIDGLVFAFKAMGIVLPIAGFFFIGNGDFSAQILALPADTAGPTLLFDLVNAGQSHLPQNPFVTSFAILIIGMIAGLEGSGFSGLPLTGSLAGALGPAVGMDPATLAAIGQMGNIWSGGGTLVAWSSLIAVAGFARVSVLDLARKCFIPVCSGLVLMTIVSVLIF